MNTEIVCLPMPLKDLNHDLRTSLTGILGIAKELEHESLTPQQKSYVEDISRSGMALLNLANRLLESKHLVTLDENSLRSLVENF